MVRRLLGSAAAAVLVLGLSAGGAFAAQPGAECGDDGATLMPHGFTTGGFANAETQYAGADSSGSLHSGNWHAVSQYDIACVHYTQAHS